MVREWAINEYGSSRVAQLGFTFCNSKSKSGRPMPYDIVILNVDGKPILIIEVDGRHHFVDDDKKNTIENDLIKELAAIDNKVSMLRLDQNSVWHSRFDWKSVVAKTLEAVLEEPSLCKIHRHPIEAYQIEAYQSIRRGTSVQL